MKQMTFYFSFRNRIIAMDGNFLRPQNKYQKKLLSFFLCVQLVCHFEIICRKKLPFELLCSAVKYQREKGKVASSLSETFAGKEEENQKLLLFGKFDEEELISFNFKPIKCFKKCFELLF